MDIEKEPRRLTVCWLSAGVSSFIAGWLMREKIDMYLYIDISDQHPDSLRFIDDCKKALGKDIDVLRSNDYVSVEQAIRAFGQVQNINTHFYPCTAWLKKRVRKEWERAYLQEHPDTEFVYIWGMDCEEKHRAYRLIDMNPNAVHRFPLIEWNLSKQDAHSLCQNLGICRPVMYDLGYNNNNCIGCVKGGMWYWNKIRVDFPEVFQRRAEMERDLNSRILKDCFLDELDPNRGRRSEEIDFECSIFCYDAMNL